MRIEAAMKVRNSFQPGSSDWSRQRPLKDRVVRDRGAMSMDRLARSGMASAWAIAARIGIGWVRAQMDAPVAARASSQPPTRN